MPTNKRLGNLLLKESLPSTWTLKTALAAVVLVTSLSALRVAYNRGYVVCSSSPEYLWSLGILSRHGDFLAQLNMLHLQITVGLLVCAIGMWWRRPAGLLLSLLGLAWGGTIYLVWYFSTSAFMVEQEIPDFALLQGPGKQHLLALREGTWWDLVVLMMVIALFVWLVKRLVGILMSSRVGHRDSILFVFAIVSICAPLTHSVIADDQVVLGQKLYFDKRLSADGTISCASCHDPATAFASKDTLAIGVRNQSGTRNVPTLLNAKFSNSFFWDGRARTLEEQAKQPLLNAAEMGFESEAALVARLSSIPEYRKAFRRLFPREGITLDTVASAIASYERTLISNNSPFDRFIKGDQRAITANQKAGWALFKGRARCIECHVFSASSPFFTDFKFYNTGVAGRDQNFKALTQRADEIRFRRRSKRIASSALAHQAEFSELGRFLVTLDDKDIGAFKTPTLRDVELTGPYMHNGSMKTLLDVVRFYNQGGGHNPMLTDRMRPLDLNEHQMSDIVEFLRSLTSDDVLKQAQFSKPQTRERVPLPGTKKGLVTRR